MVEEWDLIWRLGLALVLSSAIGLERDLRQKSAGLRTYTVVGLGAALFMLISKYGFFDLLGEQGVSLDPSRVAAQIVSGIGFIGAGLIFVRRDAVHGLTTAAGVWMTAAVGAACGADLPILAVATTAAYFFVILGLTPLAARLPASSYDHRPYVSPTKTSAASCAASLSPAPPAASTFPTSMLTATATITRASPRKSTSPLRSAAKAR